MKIGCLGDIVFEVSRNTVKTISKATWSGSAAIQTHQRHLDNSLQEFTGVNPDGFTFSMTLSRALGVEPMADIEKIIGYERTGTAVPLVIGTKAYGKYRWLVHNHKVTQEHYDGKGDVISATISITLTEYTRE